MRAAILLTCVVVGTSALRPPPLSGGERATRRSAVAGLISLPAAAHALPAFDKDISTMKPEKKKVRGYVTNHQPVWVR